MKQFKKVETTTIVNENMETETTTRTTLHTIRNWEELSLEEQDKEIEKRQEDIYCSYQDYVYEGYLCDLDNLRCDYKNITFENIYMDSNSQGWWIDRIKGFKYHNEGIDIFGEHIDIYDIDFTIRKYIKDFDIEIEDYYLTSDMVDKIKSTKKYQNWIDSIKKDIQSWIEEVNKYCSDLGDAEYDFPNKDWIDMYFENEEFETMEEVL